MPPVSVGSEQLMAQQTLAIEACWVSPPLAALQQLIIEELLPAEWVGKPATALALNARIRTKVVDHFIIGWRNNRDVLVVCQDFRPDQTSHG